MLTLNLIIEGKLREDKRKAEILVYYSMWQISHFLKDHFKTKEIIYLLRNKYQYCFGACLPWTQPQTLLPGKITTLTLKPLSPSAPLSPPDFVNYLIFSRFLLFTSYFIISCKFFSINSVLKKIPYTHPLNPIFNSLFSVISLNLLKFCPPMGGFGSVLLFCSYREYIRTGWCSGNPWISFTLLNSGFCL